ncbi:MAG: MFS transporter [Spirochaetaceae bacterium]|nr:MAG: MFS transporter [Spirochaetaceae bacterium]
MIPVDHDFSIERFDARPILLLVSVVFLTFVPRMLLAPLLLRIEASFGLTRAQAGGLFFTMSGPYSAAMLASGFVAARLTHRGTIVLSLLIVGLSLLLLSIATTAAWLRVALASLGVGAGLYAPSGIATLTGVAHARHWGKALAMHELGPILGFFSAPLLAVLAVRFATWRALFAALGVVCLLFGFFYGRVASGGRFAGAAPKLSHVTLIWSQGAFWVVALLFILAVGLEVGVYSMLPAFLVAERAMSETLANSLVALSRLTALVLVFSSGVLADRFGARLLIAVVCTAAGVATVLIGITRGALLVLVVVLQPMLVSAFFPAGFIALAGVAPAERRNLVISMVLPLAYLFGGGIVPAGIGYLSAHGHFSAGFVIVGMLMITSMLLLRTLPRNC